ncbi:TPA: LPS O-antigen chain length determinant protein WzzB [Pseudomonas aeruginosa]|uniref:LPS O-antigen chain length determinant protein WzzB n=1 Tax=Pseudomonas aeruginosa TaxID=287 RepID=UPI000F52844D|nr:Wzz/FepE/Etk N-terminal domain-containing protein [Pseudomonas aeruginosa]MCO3802175.1 chain-length determining protein [Pseudomonas aeruginosa]MDP5850707.1 Wzz/FepE/Etk N-terminal domain-containing protein [Pseudomonas aeruginosa]RPT55903.1 chain-length determining protein [Pseudomonas aeruginosa]WCV15409.1 LPS O-antigen chain length determinant protein WzzB [Pseudomonas aeruginosa]HBO1710027.1 LPS O-antigen chain length determinant protein WzzB [Pseudomonas aeruginosa]
MTENRYSRQDADGEIDLLALVQGLWAGKWIIVGTAAVVTLLAVVYAVLKEPVYESKITLLPPPLSAVAGFNIGRTRSEGLAPFTVSDVYRVFTRNLEADENRRAFFRLYYLPTLDESDRKGPQDGLYRRFNEIFTIKVPDKQQPGYTLIIERKNPAEAADWVQKYVQMVAKQSIDEMLQNARRELDVKARNMRQQVDILKESAKERRADRITQLKEALAIAKALNLVKPPLVEGQSVKQLSSIMDGSLTYMRGTEAISAEIKALESRVSDDPFIPQLRGLEERYKLYENMSPEVQRIAVFRQDGAVETPDVPVKPNKVIIVFLGGVLGFVLGMMIALFLHVLRKSRVS